MTKLLRYHTSMANPNYYWENSQVALKLKNKEITNYDEYERACKIAGCAYYNKDVFNSHLKGE